MTMQGYKTIIVNGIVLLFSVATVLNPEVEAPSTEDVNALVDKADAVILSVIALANMLLRAVTKTPMFQKE